MSAAAAASNTKSHSRKRHAVENEVTKKRRVDPPVVELHPLFKHERPMTDVVGRKTFHGVFDTREIILTGGAQSYELPFKGHWVDIHFKTKWTSLEDIRKSIADFERMVSLDGKVKAAVVQIAYPGRAWQNGSVLYFNFENDEQRDIALYTCVGHPDITKATSPDPNVRFLLSFSLRGFVNAACVGAWFVCAWIGMEFPETGMLIPFPPMGSQSVDETRCCSVPLHEGTRRRTGVSSV
jgi:hypothetical protein